MSVYTYTYDTETGRVISVECQATATVIDSDDDRFFSFADDHCNLYYINGEFVVLDPSETEVNQENIVYPGTIVGVPPSD